MTSGESFTDLLSASKGAGTVAGSGVTAVQESLLRVRRKLAEELIF